MIGGAPPGEVPGVVQLRHHVLAQRPGKPLPFLGEVLGEEHRVRRERAVPAVLADRGKEQVELADHAPVHHPAGEFGVQAGQVTLEHRPVHLAETVNVDRGVCEERGETGDRPGSRGGGRGPQPEMTLGGDREGRRVRRRPPAQIDPVSRRWTDDFAEVAN